MTFLDRILQKKSMQPMGETSGEESVDNNSLGTGQSD